MISVLLECNRNEHKVFTKSLSLSFTVHKNIKTIESKSIELCVYTHYITQRTVTASMLHCTDRVNKNVLSLFVSLCLVTAWLKGLRVPLQSAGIEYKTELSAHTKHVLCFSADILMINKSTEI